MWFLIVAACAGSTGPDPVEPTPGDTAQAVTYPDAGDTDEPSDTDVSDPWAGLRADIDASSLGDATVLFGTAEGVVFEHDKGDSDADKVYLAASGSKLLASLTVLRLVDAGVLALDDVPQDHLDWWPTDPADPRTEITLEQLLSFTSGLEGGVDDVPCLEDGDSTIAACAEEIAEGRFAHAPGSTFFYGPSHLQVAGALVSAQQGQSWNRIFREQVGRPLGLASTTAFASPSLSNPRVAGGATISAADYGAVLQALAAGTLLRPETVELLVADHTPDGVTRMNVPDSAGSWHYALGCWRECAGDAYTSQCDQPGVVSSPGAFGFYPLWDQARGIWGVVATHHPDGPSATIPLGQGWLESAAAALGR